MWAAPEQAMGPLGVTQPKVTSAALLPCHPVALCCMGGVLAPTLSSSATGTLGTMSWGPHPCTLAGGKKAEGGEACRPWLLLEQ